MPSGQFQMPASMMEQSKQMVCPQCGGLYFTEVLSFREVSRIITQTDKDVLIPMKYFKCDTCELVVEQLMKESEYKEALNKIQEDEDNKSGNKTKKT